MKKILTLVLILINILIADCNTTNEAMYTEFKEAGYNSDTINKYINKKICVTGTIKELEKNMIRIENGQKDINEINTIFYATFKIFDHNDTYTNYKLTKVKTDNNISLICEPYTGYNFAFKNCTFQNQELIEEDKELQENNNSIIKSIERKNKTITFSQNNWYMINAELLTFIENKDINYIWEYDSNIEKWKIQDNINNNYNNYEKINNFGYEKSYWIKTKNNFTINFIPNKFITIPPPPIGQ